MTFNTKNKEFILIKTLSFALLFSFGFAQAALPPDTTKPATEDDYYYIATIPIPEGIVLEGGGVAAMPGGKLAVATRRGEVWVISNPYFASTGIQPTFKLFAQGLQ